MHVATIKYVGKTDQDADGRIYILNLDNVIHVDPGAMYVSGFKVKDDDGG